MQLILPTLFQVWLWTPPRSALLPPPPAARRTRSVWYHLQRAADAGNRSVHVNLGGASRRHLVRAALAYYLLSNAWVLAKV